MFWPRIRQYALLALGFNIVFLFFIVNYIFRSHKCANLEDVATEQIIPTTAVIILTYVRSGSSLLGELFNQHPESFYLFEPLFALYEHDAIDLGSHSKTTEYMYPNGTMRPFPMKGAEKEIVLDTLENILTCKLNHVPVDVLAPHPHAKHIFFTYGDRHKRLGNYTTCILSRRGVKEDAECIPIIHDICRKSLFAAIKVIRLRMSLVEHLLRRLPGLRVIHLVRDPRASLLSRSTLFKEKIGYDMLANKLCYDMTKDMFKGKQLAGEFPGRIMQVKYETLAEHPLETAAGVYQFLGLPLPLSVRTWMWQNTNKGSGSSNQYITSRKNSSETANAWKTKISPSVALQVQSICKNVLEDLNYEPFTQSHPVDEMRQIDDLINF